MECEAKGCTESGILYQVAWREHGVILCKVHAKDNSGILSQGKKEEELYNENNPWGHKL